MSIFVSLLLRLLVVGMSVSTPMVFALGEEMSPKLRDRIEASKEWSSLAKGRTEFEVSDPELLPSRLASAAEHSGCRYKDGIKESPVSFLKLGSRRLAIVYCWAIVGSHQIFDLTSLERPRLIEFPFLAQPEGFGTTPRPGGITWKKQDGIFLAQTGSDMLPTLNVRHTYRFTDVLGTAAFVVVRVEVQQVPGPEEWTMIWDAPRWSFPVLADPPLSLPWQQK